MKIAIDIDDTLTDTFDYLQPCVAEYFGASIEALRKANISYSNLPPEWKKDEPAFGKAYFDHVIVNTPFKPGAAEAVKELRARGSHITILTARTEDFYTDPYRTTELELKEGGIVYDKLVCRMDKAGACTEESIDLLIDDSVEHCEEAQSLGVQVLLFTSPANRDAQVHFPRVHTWEEVLEYMKTLTP